MTFITLTDDRGGLSGFPVGFTPVGRDDLGDVLASDLEGRVWVFPHGAGDWTRKTPAFASVQDLARFVAFQAKLEIPTSASLDALRSLKAEVEAFVKGLRQAPYAREAARECLASLREEIADKRFAGSRRGKSLAARQELGQRCDEALRAAGAPGQWIVRPHSERSQALVVMGPVSAEWNEQRLRAVLQPLLHDEHELLFFARP